MPASGMTADRLRRVLAFLSVSGGAALLSKREHRIVAEVGDITCATALATLTAAVEADGAVVYVSPGGLIADVGARHRLYVRVPPGMPNPAFVDRVRRARDLVERFALHALGPPRARGAPPTSAPAHAVVFAPQRARDTDKPS